MTLTPNFIEVPVDLQGVGTNRPTSLQFGPDGRLYFAQQNGLIRSVSLKPIFENGQISKVIINNAGGVDTTNLVKSIPNHDDDGTLTTDPNAKNRRQVTGLLVEEGPNGEIVLYVSSSDPREGGGDDGEETDLDTNSGIISRLVKQPDGSWDKVDLVIGLPRSEENHSTNGLDIRMEEVDGEMHKIMYAASGGSTNRGAPSNNFAWTPEYYYSAAILRIDLTLLEEMEATEGLQGGTDYVDEFVYALPTLNDPTRPDSNGRDTVPGVTGAANAIAADTFGGNDGLNQAKYDPLGIVQVYSPGYRNSYDLIITENNNIYTVDNGPNNGWGDVPLEADGLTPITDASQVATNHPNIDVNTGSDNDPDNLHLVTSGFYGGHPNPVYASGPAAGLYRVDASSGTPVVTRLTDPSDPDNDPNTVLDDLPSDWDTIAGGLTFPEVGVYNDPAPEGGGSPEDGALEIFSSSTNGLAEYIVGKATGSYPITDNPDAEILIAVSFNGDINFIEVVSDGTQQGTTVTDTAVINVDGTPLDVRDTLAVGTENMRNTIFVAKVGSSTITALVPGDTDGPDVDKDDDGLLDSEDPFQYDPGNGTTIVLNDSETLFWDFKPSEGGQNPGKGTPAEGEFNIGMTGWMINGTDDLFSDPDDPDDRNLAVLANTIRGGAPGIFQIKLVTEGDSEGTDNTQQDALQTGFLPAEDVQSFTIKVPIYNPFTSDANSFVNFGPEASMGIALGDGSQSNFVKVALGYNSDSEIRAQVIYEEGDTIVASESIPADFLLNGSDDEVMDLLLDVDMNTFEATARWNYLDNGTPGSGVIGTVNLDPNGQVVRALKGENTIGGQQSAAAVTLLATSTGEAQPFTADFLSLTIEANSDDPVEVDLELIKTVSNTAPTVGENVTFELTVSNTSTENATGVSVKDLLPAGFAYVSHSGGTYDPDTGIWQVNAVNADATKQLSITATVNDPEAVAVPTVLYRINNGGGAISATDSTQPNWSADSGSNPSPYRADNGGGTWLFSTGQSITLDSSVPEETPVSLFKSERFDTPGKGRMKWAFPLLTNDETVEVRLYFAETFSGISAPGQRVFDVAVEGTVPTPFDDIDPFATAGLWGGFMRSHELTVTDGTLNLEFINNIENPALKGIEIIGRASGAGSADDYVNYAEVLTLDQLDSDSVAGDGSTGDDDDASVTVTVPTSTNTPPVAVNDAFDTDEDTSLVDGNVLANDTDDDSGDTLSVTAVNGVASDVGTQITLGSGALLTLNSNGSFDYDPNGQFESLDDGETAEDSFAYTVSDGNGGTDTATVDITVAGVNDTVEVDLELIKTVSNTAPTVGENVVFKLTVSNTSSENATGVSVKDLLPAGFTYVSHSGGTYDPDTGIWQVNAVNAEATKQLSITATVNDPEAVAVPTVLYRVNNGGGAISASDSSQPNWSADNSSNPSPYRVNNGGGTWLFSTGQPITLNSSVPEGTPVSLFKSERFDTPGKGRMKWAFPLLTNDETVEVRLYFAETFSGISAPGQRVFDVAAEGNVPIAFDDIDPFATAGLGGGFMRSHELTVTDGTLNLEFINNIENPALKGIEIIGRASGAGSADDYVNYAEVLTLDQIDSDSVAGDGSTGDDDDASVGVPLPPAGDTTPPVVDLVSAEVILREKTTPHTISVTYSDAGGSGLDVSSFDAGDITATGNASGIELTPSSTPPEILEDSDGTVTVDYKFEAPGGTWDAADNDSYVIALNSSEVFDIAGNAAVADASLNSFLVSIDEPVGAATLEITVDKDDVQASNYGSNSFKVTNTGDKDIAKVELDVTEALYPDAVFDPFGKAGDSVAKPLTLNTKGDTGVVAPNNKESDPNNQTYIGAGGAAGYKGIQLFFNESVYGGFNPGESLGFSIDMDPNSVAGTQKSPLIGGSTPRWDVGGVSGAELIGSSFTVTFTDGTTAVGQLQGAGNQAGSKGLADQDSPDLAVDLTVNGLTEGGVGTYNSGGPSVVINGPAGETARVVLTKGFIQPIDPYAQFLADQLDTLAASDFPANNAVEFQTEDILLTGGNQNISDRFDFSKVDKFNFSADPAFPLSVDEDKLSLGFTASAIDPTNSDLPLGEITQPIYLAFDPVVV